MGLGSGFACDLTLYSSLTEELRARYQDQATIRRVMTEARTIAVVGLSTRPQKASNLVATYLRFHGYRIVPVHPLAESILGEPAYSSLLNVPNDISIVCVFRPAHECPEIARQTAEIGASVLWLQLGIVSEEAGAIAEDLGVDVVMDRCLKMEHGRYDGTMHLLGMNTGIVTARRAKSIALVR